MIKKSVISKRALKRASLLYVMISIPILWYILFCYVPMGGLIIAFKKYSLFKGMIKSPWIGFAHFERFLTAPDFWKVLLNTMRLGALNLIICFPAPIILALIINEIRGVRFKRFTQTVSYLPHFVSTAALTNILIVMLSPSLGVINNAITGLGFTSVNFIVEYVWFPAIYIFQLIWRDLGWGTIIYLAAISGVDMEQYEAAAIDGAGRWLRMWHVTLPAILPVISIMLILAVPSILGTDFETVLLLQRPVTFETSDVVQTYIYRRGILNAEYDFTTAIHLVFSIFSITLILISNKVSSKLSGNGIW